MRKITPPLTQRKRYEGIPGVGHPGEGIAPLLSRKIPLSKEELEEKINQRYANRFQNKK